MDELILKFAKKLDKAEIDHKNIEEILEELLLPANYIKIAKIVTFLDFFEGDYSINHYVGDNLTVIENNSNYHKSIAILINKLNNKGYDINQIKNIIFNCKTDHPSEDIIKIFQELKLDFSEKECIKILYMHDNSTNFGELFDSSLYIRIFESIKHLSYRFYNNLFLYIIEYMPTYAGRGFKNFYDKKNLYLMQFIVDKINFNFGENIIKHVFEMTELCYENPYEYEEEDYGLMKDYVFLDALWIMLYNRAKSDENLELLNQLIITSNEINKGRNIFRI